MDLSKLQSTILKKGYSIEEVEGFYALGKLYLETGNIHQASSIFDGLVETFPDFFPALLAQSVTSLIDSDYTEAIQSAQRVLDAEPQLIEGLLLLVIGMLRTENYNSAGTYLGEVRELLESGSIKEENLIRLYKMLLAQYKFRSSV